MLPRKSIKFEIVLCASLILMFVLTSYSTGNSAQFQNPTTFRCIKGWHGEKRCMTKDGKKINYAHDGVDITGCPGGPSIDGAEVRPYMEGKVEKVDDKGKGGFGKYVIIDHGNGFKTQYSHLKDVGVKDGQEIKSGDLDTAIGHVDNTGFSFGPHLDLKMYYEQNGKQQFVDPLGFLPGNYNCISMSSCEKGKSYCPDMPPDRPFFTDGYGKFDPGNDHSDDTFSVGNGLFLDDQINLESAYYRLAGKKGNLGTINSFVIKSLIQQRDLYLENLPEDSIPDANYLNNIDDQISQLYSNAFGDQEIFWEEYDKIPDVGIFWQGFGESWPILLSRFQEPTIRRPIDSSPENLGNQPILIIPSGGLYGLEKSEFLKASLDGYVKNGGTLIVFGQQHGYEFSVLPVPQEADGTNKRVSGYGWSEDQSCHYASSFIETWHQILSGQSNATPSINVDGYFTEYPSDSTVLLRRTANGQPDLLMYEHGQGRVIVTSMYSDFASTRYQAFYEEIALIRDIISWAKKPAQLPEIKPGQSVSVSVSVTNNTTNDASSLRLLIYNPDRTTLLSERNISASVQGGQSATIPVTYTTTQWSALGIYHIDYVLYNSSGTIIQPQAETDSGRFAVSNPATNPYKPKDLLYSVNISRGYFLPGESIPITVTIWNNSNSDKRLRYYRDYSHSVATFIDEAQVPAHGSISRDYILPGAGDQVMLWVHFFEENGIPVWYQTSVNAPGETWPYVGSGGMTIPIIHPYASTTVKTDKAFYAKGETVAINISLQNQISLGWQPNVQIFVYGPRYNKILGETYTITLPPSGTGSVSTSFTLPPDSTIGSYYVNVYIPSGPWLWGSGSANAAFEVAESQISVSPNLPAALNTGTNSLPFTITNSGKINVSSGTLDYSLIAPGGASVYSGSQSFSIAVGETKALPIPISIPSIKLGYYTLNYSQSDETRTGKPTSIILWSGYSLSPSLDKSSYKIGETANITVSIANTGKFIQEGSLTIDASFAGFSETKPVTISPSETVNIPYSLPLPFTLTEGGPVNLTLTFPSGDRVESGVYLAIKPVGIKQDTVFDKSSYRVRENLGINWIITNDGNFATPLNVSFNLSIPDLNYTYEGSLALDPAQTKEIPLVIPIPETLSPGLHKVSVALAVPWQTTLAKETGFAVPESSLKLNYVGTTTPTAGDTISLSIENTGGVDTTYTTQNLSINDARGIDIYRSSVTGSILTGEQKPFVDIQIPAQALNGPAYLHVQMKDNKAGKTIHYDKPIQVTGMAASLQTRTDKEVYLKTEALAGISTLLNGAYGIEGGNLKVSVKIPSVTGNFAHFLPQKGWWLFNAPSGVAIGPDGSIYVADTYNSCIVKFDSNKNFIMKWGEYCTTDSDYDGVPDQTCEGGKFNDPHGIAIGPDGSVYVVDKSNHRIQKFDSNGNFITKWESYGSGDGQFNNPRGVAVGPDGSVYVADTGNNCIQKFDSNGNFIAKWRVAYVELGFRAPSGVAVGVDGSVYVADTGRYHIEKFDSDGNFITWWGGLGTGNGQFRGPSGIAVGLDGFVYVTDVDEMMLNFYRIQKFDNNGNFITQWGSPGVGDGEFASPYGIAIDSGGSVYVADTWNHRIQKFDSNGDFLTKWGRLGSGNGELANPEGIAIGADSSIYIADGWNNRIQKFDSSGNFITKWGSYCETDPNRDGVPENSCDAGQFGEPSGVAMGPDGSVYVADNWNQRIQRFDSSGNFITQWADICADAVHCRPLGIAIGPDGAIYVANHIPGIQKYDSNGNLVIEWGEEGTGNGQFSWDGISPVGIAVGSDGSVYVADSWNNRIQKFNSNGNFITKWGEEGSGDGQFWSPGGITVAPDGSVYVADSGNYRIQKFDTSGNFIKAWESTYNTGNGDGEFYIPVGVAVASDGSVFVLDSELSRVQKMAGGNVTETLFETTLPINQPASATQDYTANVGTLGVTGKLLLQADLKNSLGEAIAQASYPFYIVDGNTVLLINTDKKVYKLGETVTITGQVQNLAAIEAAGLTLTLNSQLGTQNPGLLYTESFSIPAGGTHPFTITTTAGVEGIITITGNVTQNNSTLAGITDQYEVAKPNVSVALSMPEVIGGEPFNINVEMKNTGKVDGNIQFGIQSSEFGDSQTVPIPAGEIKLLQYSQQISKDTTYTFTFTGDLEQTLQQVVRFGEKAEVQVTLQPSYKEGDLVIPYQLKNTGELQAVYPVTFTLSKDGQEISRTTRTFTLPVNGSISDSLSYNLGEGSYLLRYETSGYQAESQINVAKAAQGEITMAVNDFYPEGAILLPYTVKNTGAFDAEFAFEIELGTSLVSKAISIPAGGNYSGDLSFNLPFGNYTIKATLASQPSNPFTKSFQVVKENNVQMAIALGAQTNGLIPVNVNLTNLGFNEFSGSVDVSVSPSAGQAVWTGVEPLSQLSPQGSQLLTLNINPSAINPGNYSVQVTLLNNSNQPVSTQSLPLGIQGPTFQITQLPPYQTFQAGQEATFSFTVKNTGNQEGSFDLSLKAYDLIDSTQREWLKPNEEKAIPFGFMLPEDLEEKDYFANYELKAQSSAVSGQVKYHLAGISLNVNATLDKPYYTEGETAHLTVNIQSPNSNPQNLFARANYAGYEPQQTFTLSGSQVLIFDIPLPQITGEKLFYGVYHESGRSIHLNSVYIHKAGDVITITTDKQVYNPGETVSVTASGSTSGNLTLSGPGGYTETFAFTGSATKSFTLPATVAAGTYFISYQLSTTGGESYTGTYPFDVAGIQVKVLECNNDKAKYASSDNIATSFTISSNTTMPALLKAWIVDPTGQYVSVGEQTITLSSSESSLVTSNSALSTSVSGIHRLVYGIYGPEDLLLCSGSEAFDVGDAVLMGISTDKRDYPTNTEPVTVAASLYGSVSADLQIELDGSVVKTEAVSLNGFTSYSTQVQNIIPGPHTLKVTLTAGGLKSTKETSFTYALAYMPKPQISASPAYLDFGSLNLGSTSTQSITLSSTGNVDLVVGTITLSGTNQGEFSIQSDNCSGRTITPSGNCTLGILFSPNSLGSKSASLSVPSNAVDTPALYLALGGAGATTLNLSINPGSGGRVTGTGIDCPGDCTETFSTSGAAIELTATPSEGYVFTNWTGDITVTDSPVTVNMDTHKNVTANFAINAYTITATAGLGGNISPAGLVTVNSGSSQTFLILPSLGYHIAEVIVDGEPKGAVTAYTFDTVKANHAIEALFAINQYTIIATAGPNGAIIPLGAITVDHGGSLTFTITPNPGYGISDLKIDGVSVVPVTTYTFTDVTSAHTIEASFAANQHTINTAVGSNGTITPSGSVTIEDGGSQTFTITPDTGYRISDVEVDGVMLGVTKTYTFSNVTSDHTIHATFKQIQGVNLPFSDNFEDDPVGTQPNLPWDNFNGGPAIVAGIGSHSPTNSISVSSGPEGSGSAFVNLGETYSDRIAYEVWVKVNSTGSSTYVGFSEEILGIMPQFNAVYFNGTDGKVYFTSVDRDHGFMVPILDNFAIGVWHKVRVQIDFENLIADVFIDDVHAGSGLQVSPKDAAYEYEGAYTFQLNKIGVTHALGEPVSFDDFSISEWNPNTPVGLLRSAGPGQWAVLGMGGIGSASSTNVSMSGSSSVSGTVANSGVANAGIVNMSGSSLINGILSLNTAGHLSKSGTSAVAGGVHQDTATDGILDQAVADALAASQSAASLAATITSPTSVTISNPSQNITITGGAGTNVLNITNLAISNGTLTLNAPHGGYFILNVSGNFALSGASSIVLTGGITSSDVLYNFVGTGGGVAMNGGASAAGILLAPQRGMALSNSIVTGEIISGGSSIGLSGTTQVRNPGP